MPKVFFRRQKSIQNGENNFHTLKKNLRICVKILGGGVLLLTVAGFAFATLPLIPGILSKHNTQGVSQSVLGVTNQPAVKLQGSVTFNIPAIFNDTATFKKDITVDGNAVFNSDVTIHNKNLDLGTGIVTAANLNNLINGITPGPGISATPGQTPTITNTGVLSVGGKTGDVTLTAGSGVSISGITITNTGVTSFGGQSGSVALTAGSGISVSGTTITNTLAPSLTANGVAYSADGSTLTSLTPASSGFLLQSNGSGAAPSWVTSISLGGTLTDTTFHNGGGLLFTNTGGLFQQTGTGTSSQCLIGGATPSWATCASGSSGTQYWQLNGSILSPINASYDLTIGGSATGSAFQVFAGANGTIPAGTASTSGQLTFSSSSQVNLLNNASLAFYSSPGGDAGLLANPALFIQKPTNANNSGNIGIGTAAPSAPLDFRFSTTNFGTVMNIGNVTNGVQGQFSFDTTATGKPFKIWSNKDLVLGSNFTEQMRITTAGFVGIGNTIPGNDSLVVNQPNATGDIFSASQGGNLKFQLSNTGAITAKNYTTSGGVFFADSTGLLTQTGTSTSSQCLIGGTTPTWATCANGSNGTNYWQLNGTVLSPANANYDLSVGGNATGSAFQVFANANGTIPAGTASTSGQLTFANTSTFNQVNILNNQNLDFYNSVAGDTGESTIPALRISKNGKLLLNVDRTGTLNPGGFQLDVSGDIGPNGDLGTNIGTNNQRINSIYAKQLNITAASTVPVTALFAQTSVTAGNALIILNQTSAVGDIFTASQAGQTKFQITNAGSVGIGTATPLATLDLRQISGTIPIASISGVNSFTGLLVDNSGSGDLISASKSGASLFTVNNNGNVGINSTSPTFLLTALRPSSSVTTWAQFGATGNSGIQLRGDDGTGVWLRNDGANANLSTKVGNLQYGYSGRAGMIHQWFNQTNELMRLTTGGNLGLTAGVNPLATLDVRVTANNIPSASISGATGLATLIVDQTGVGDIFSASQSGAPRFTIGQDGTLTDSKYTTNGGLFFANTSGVFSQTGAGTASQCLIGGATPTWATCASGTNGTNYWQLNGPIVSPSNANYDLAIGGNATGSAFQVFANANGSNPAGTASTSGFLTFKGNGTQQINILNGGTLGLYTSVGGDTGVNTSIPAFYVANTGNIGIQTTSTSNVSLTVNTLAPALTAGSKLGISGTPFNTAFMKWQTSVNGIQVGSGTLTAGGTGSTNSFGGGNSATATISGATSFAELVVDQSGAGDIFTASQSGAPRFTITNNGFVGVNQSVPTARLDVGDAGSSNVLIEGLGNSSSAELDLQAISAGGVQKRGSLSMDNTGRMIFNTNGFGNNNRMAIQPNGNIGIGTISPNTTLDVRANLYASPIASLSGATGMATLVLDQSGSADLIAASQSGAARFTVAQNGNITDSNYTTAGGIFYATNTGLMQITAAGSNSQCLLGGANPGWGSCSGAASTNQWINLSGALVPVNNTQDLVYGSATNATSSAKFAVINMASGTPTATLSATATGTGLSFGGDGTIQSLQNSSLTIGGNTTGNIILKPVNGSGNIGINTSSPVEALHVNGNILIDKAPDQNSGSTFTMTNATAGTFGGNANLSSATSSAVFNGKLFVSVAKNNNAAVYRYDGGTTWTMVVNALGKVISSDSNINSMRLAVYNGALYIGSDTGAGGAAAGVYSSTNADTSNTPTWTLINTTLGSFNVSGGGQSAIDGVSDMAVWNGQLYVGTRKQDLTELYAYKGGTGTANFKRVNTTGAGRFVAADVADASSLTLAPYGQDLMVGVSTGIAATARVFRFDGSGFTLINTTRGQFDNGVASPEGDVTAMTVWNGQLFIGTARAGSNSANVYLYTSTTQFNTGASVFKQINSASGKMISGDAQNNISIPVIRGYNGRLYVGTNTSAGTGALFAYDPTNEVFTAVNGVYGTFGSQTSENALSVLEEMNGTLYVGTTDYTQNNAAVYTWKFNTNVSYALKFNSSGTGNNNLGAISFVQGVDTASNNSHTGSFLFSNGIMSDSGAFDYAESYPTFDASLTAGDVVAVDPSSPGFVTKATPTSGFVGVYSTNPGFLLSEKPRSDGAKSIPIALTGRVPVKVSLENGPIAIGDYLTASASQSGVAVKAIQKGMIIGQAMSPLSGDISTTGMVTASLKISWYDPSVFITQNGTLNVSPSLDATASASAIASLATDAVPQVKQISTNALQLQSSADISELKIQIASLSAQIIKPSQMENLSQRIALLEKAVQLTSSASTSGSENLLATQNATVSGGLTVLGKSLFSDVGITGKVSMGLLKIDGMNDTAGGPSLNTLAGALNLQSDGLNGINIMNGKVTIDTTGNITASSSITAKKYNIDTSDASGASVGNAVLKAGTTQVVVRTTAVSGNSKIFLTPHSPSVLGITSQVKGSSFTVEMDKGRQTDLEFDWFIVN